MDLVGSSSVVFLVTDMALVAIQGMGTEDMEGMEATEGMEDTEATEAIEEVMDIAGKKCDQG